MRFGQLALLAMLPGLLLAPPLASADTNIGEVSCMRRVALEPRRSWSRPERMSWLQSGTTLRMVPGGLDTRHPGTSVSHTRRTLFYHCPQIESQSLHRGHPLPDITQEFTRS